MMRFINGFLFIISILSIFTVQASVYPLSSALSSQSNNLLKQLKLPVFLNTIFVDPKLNQVCQQYDPKSRSCGSGNYLALPKITLAVERAKPGDLFLLRAGIYKQALHIKNSGNQKAYIGFSAYRNEKVILSGVNSIDNGQEYGAIWLDETSYIWINGITVKSSIGFGRFLNAHNNVFSYNHFTGSTIYNDGKGASKRGGLYVAFSHHNKIINNKFEKGTDLLALVHSDYNLVQGNNMNLAGHDIWNIKCGSFNVIRGNVFSNKKQKLGSVFDCENATMNWHGNGRFKQVYDVLDASKHNVIENNIFKDAVRYYSASGGNGIQYAGQNGIVRFNTFYHTNVGFGLSSYPTEASYNYGNRIYNNTFHDNWCVGISVGRWVKRFEDNQFINNILWNNQGLGRSQCGEKSAKQVLFNKKEGDQWFVNNNIASDISDKVIGLWGKAKELSVYDFEGSFVPVQFKNTLAKDPLFVDQNKHNYQLSSLSPMIDAGIFLTKITSESGKGKNIAVLDSLVFYDGVGINNETGDVIMIQSVADKSIQQATIMNIDRNFDLLTLDKQVSWQKGDLISLSFKGKKPDIGAFEFNQKLQ